MKVVLVGASQIDGRDGPVWDAVRDVLRSLGPQDVVVHTGGGDAEHVTIGSRVDSIVRRAKGNERRRLPKVEVQLPEIGRYDRIEALKRNAVQLLHHQMPAMVVYIGDGEDEESKPVRDLWESAKSVPPYSRIVIKSHEDFISERARRA